SSRTPKASGTRSRAPARAPARSSRSSRNTRRTWRRRGILTAKHAVLAILPCSSYRAWQYPGAVVGYFWGAVLRSGPFLLRLDANGGARQTCRLFRRCRERPRPVRWIAAPKEQPPPEPLRQKDRQRPKSLESRFRGHRPSSLTDGVNRSRPTRGPVNLSGQQTEGGPSRAAAFGRTALRRGIPDVETACARIADDLCRWLRHAVAPA